MLIATHDGPFHADDVMAVAALLLEYPHAKVVRTRDPAALAKADIVVDVGAVYNALNDRFDHHQKGRAGGRANGVLYSAFGLVWKHHGRALADNPDVWRLVDERLVSPIDALDNGQDIHRDPALAFAGVAHATLSETLSSFNPTWEEQEKGTTFDAAFDTTICFAQQILKRAIEAARSEVVAQTYLRRCVDQGRDSKVVELDRDIPWSAAIHTTAPEALFVIFPSPSGAGVAWMVQCVPPAYGSFEQKQPLPEKWAGLRDDAFARETGVKDAVFCHPARFICGAGSLESARKLAALAQR